MKQVTFLHIDLLDGLVMDKQEILVNPSQPIVEQVLNQVIIGDDKQLIIKDMLPQFRTIGTQHILKGTEFLYIIV